MCAVPSLDDDAAETSADGGGWRTTPIGIANGVGMNNDPSDADALGIAEANDAKNTTTDDDDTVDDGRNGNVDGRRRPRRAVPTHSIGGKSSSSSAADVHRLRLMELRAERRERKNEQQMITI